MDKKATGKTQKFLPDRNSLKAAREAVQECRGCDLYKNATQAVFGEGLKKAKILFVGEVPGDKEDIQGHPFVGPAGKILDQALQELGINRKDVYVTNAVKHFKWTPRGKRRLHQKPSSGEVKACKPWLELEATIVKPDIVVCLGTTAAYSVFGHSITIKSHRGKIHRSELAEKTIVASHPSSILRQKSNEDRKKAYKNFLDDLRILIR